MIEREAVSMRIDAYNAVSQVYKTSAYAKDKSIAVKKTEKDKYELSYNISSEAVADKMLESISTLTF